MIVYCAMSVSETFFSVSESYYTRMDFNHSFAYSVFRSLSSAIG